MSKKKSAIRTVLPVMAAVMAIISSLFSVIPAQAAEETASASSASYGMSYSYVKDSCKDTDAYYYIGFLEFSCPYQIFMYADPNNELVASTLERYYMGYVDEDGICRKCTGTTGVIFEGSEIVKYRREDGSRAGVTKSTGTPCAAQESLLSCWVYKLSNNSFSCSGYLFDSLGSAQNYFDYGVEDGLLHRPEAEVPDPDDPESDPDLDPESFYGKVLEMLRTAIFGNWKFEAFLDLFSNKIFKDWTFAKFLNFFNTIIFGDWSFTRFLDEFNNNIFGDWKFSSFLEMFRTSIFGSWDFTDFKEFLSAAVFGNWDFESIKTIFREHLSGFSFDELLTVVKNALVGSSPKYKSIYDFLEEKTSSLNFESMLDLIREGMFGGVRFLNVFDFLSSYFDEHGLSSLAGDIKDLVMTALYGDGEHNLFGIIFVPSEEFMQDYLSGFQKKFPLLFQLHDLGEHVIDSLTSIYGGEAPVITVPLPASTSFNLGNTSVTIDFSWYAAYKPTVDLLLAGIIWVGFIWRMYCRIPEIISGVGMSIQAPYRMEQFEVRNERMQETMRRSDIRWQIYVEQQNNHGRNIK